MKIVRTLLGIILVISMCGDCISECYAAEQSKSKQNKKRNRRQPEKPVIKIGQVAPDFSLPVLKLGKDKDGKPTAIISNEKVTLSAFKNKKPIYLIFSSYT